MSRWEINWKCTYKKMPQKVKEYMMRRLGKEETRKLMAALRAHKWIMLVGPECSGKSTISNILRRLGYPFVIDENGIGVVIHTSDRLKDLKPTDDILAEIGIDLKC